MTTATPPKWAERALGFFVASRDRDTVSGDLLEAYRDSILPSRGSSAANRWYVRQVVGFAWRANRLWAVLFSASYFARTAYDWLVPTTDFSTRSTVSTYVAAGILLYAGFWAAWRSNLLRSGLVTGIVTMLIAALMCVVGNGLLLAAWHDPETLAAIEASGGIGEAFTLPVMLVVPAAVLGLFGGVIGATARRLAR